MILTSSIVNAGTTVEQPIEGGFAVTLPEGVTVSEESPVEDFILYKFKNSAGKLFLVAYLGNHPKALNAPRGSTASQSVVSGLLAEITRWPGPNSTKFGDIRLRLQSAGWPSWLQFSYGPLSEADAGIAEQISTSAHRLQGTTTPK